MNDNLIDVKKLRPFTRFCMTIGELPTSYLISMTYEEQLLWFCNYLEKTVIPTINTNAEAVIELQNYLKNLDFQDEVNNKIDEMVEDGTFQAIVGDLLTNKLDYYKVDNTFTQSDIQTIMNSDRAKIIEFEDGNYSFSNTFILNKNTTLLLNNANLEFSNVHGFFNFQTTDTFTEYNGNGNIKIIGGTINAGISFIHASNLVFKNINFYHVLNDHVFELCALNDVTISDCTFEGIAVQNESRQYVEYIQIDDCTYENFPWLTENSETYDETTNSYITIENCVFKKPNIITYAYYTAIGGHTKIDEKYHQYITIKNNKFEEGQNSTIRLYNSENIVIDNNIFRSTLTKVSAINLRWHIKNIIISNNDSNQQYFLENETRSINVTVKNNYLHDISETADTYNLIYTQPCTNMKITGNIIENVYSRIIDNRTRDNLLDNEIIIFEDNIIRCETSGSFNQYLLALYGSSHVYVNNNILDITPTNSACCFLRLSENVLSATMRNNNLYNKNTNNMEPNGYTGSYKDIYGLFVVATGINSASLSEQTSTYPVLQFNRIGINCGTGSNTQNFEFKPFGYQDRLTARTYKFNCVDNDGVADIGTFVITSEGKLNYSTGNSKLNVRQIILFNEPRN